MAVTGTTPTASGGTESVSTGASSENGTGSTREHAQTIRTSPSTSERTTSDLAIYESDVSDLYVVGLDWDSEFLPWFDYRWEPGQHVALVGPTGTGKTTLMVGVLPLRQYVLALDPKGGDSTLSRLLDVGFIPSDWPPDKEVRKAIEEGDPARLIIGSRLLSTEQLPQLRQQIQLALRDSFNERGWTVYIDELQIVSDRRFMNLGGSVERNLIAARDRKVSMVMSFQRPANVPRSASEMATWFIVLYTRDRDTVDRIAEMAGRPSAEIRGLVKGLPEYCVLVFSRNPRDPVVATMATKVG